MRYIGIKQVLKSVKENKVNMVYIAKDAESHVTSGLIELCKSKNIKITYIETMLELGKMAKIDIGTSAMSVVD